MNIKANNNIIDNFLDLILLTFPEISDESFHVLKERYRKSNIILFERDMQTSFHVPVIANNSLISEVTINKNNMTIDFVPIWYNNCIVQIKPIVLLDKKAVMFTVIHELCHLLSIGKYEIFDDSITHSFGILSYRYQLTGGKIVLSDAMGNDIENEQITNKITKIIIRYVMKNEVCSKGDYKDFFRYFHC